MTPDTTRYFYSAYAIIFVTLTFYVISLIVRWNNLQRDMDTLNELEKDKEGK
jgi:CcmD family protein